MCACLSGVCVFDSLGEPLVTVFLRPTGCDEDVTVSDDLEAGMARRNTLVHRQEANAAPGGEVKLRWRWTWGGGWREGEREREG